MISLGLCEDPTEHNHSRSSRFCRSSLVPPFLRQEESNTAAETFLHQESPLFLLPTFTVISTWTEHPSAVSKDTGCSSNFSAGDSHYRERESNCHHQTLPHFSAQKDSGRRGSVTPRTLKWAKRNVSYMEPIIHKQFN